MGRHDVTVYEPADRPDVEVLIDDDWYAGELRMSWRDDAGEWWGQVQWRPPGTHSRRFDTFPAAEIRLGQHRYGPRA